jgi:hypothetical protein
MECLLIQPTTWNLGILGFCRITKSSDGKLVLRPEALALFATHYKTGEMIQWNMCKKLKKA